MFSDGNGGGGGGGVGVCDAFLFDCCDRHCIATDSHWQAVENEHWLHKTNTICSAQLHSAQLKLDSAVS